MFGLLEDLYNLLITQACLTLSTVKTCILTTELGFNLNIINKKNYKSKKIYKSKVVTHRHVNEIC